MVKGKNKANLFKIKVRIGMTILPAGTRPDGWGYGYEILPAGMGMYIKFYPLVERG